MATKLRNKQRMLSCAAAPEFQQEVVAGKHHLVADEPLSVGVRDAGRRSVRLFTRGARRLHFDDNRTVRASEIVWLSKTLRFRSRTHASMQRTCEECETKQGMLDRNDVEVELTGSLTPEQHAKLMQVAAKCPVSSDAHVRNQHQIKGR
jgi:putative redox protein